MIPIRDETPRFSTPFITYFLVGLNTLIFLYEWLLGMQSPRALNALIFQLGVVPTHVTEALGGVPHYELSAAFLPILTSMFLHGSWLHVIGNMWILWIFGDNIEDYLGHFVYLVFYLVCGFAASVAHVLLNLNSGVPSIGASGAIAGVMGAYFVLYPRGRVLSWFPPIFFFHLPAWVFLGYWFLMQFLSATSIEAASQGGTGIAFWAHVGGFIAGIVLIKLLPERAHRYRYGTW